MKKKYPEGFVRDQFGNWIDDGDYYEDGELPKDHWRRTGEFPSGHMNGEFVNESRRKNKVRLTESQLQRVIKESVKKVLKESHKIYGFSSLLTSQGKVKGPNNYSKKELRPYEDAERAERHKNDQIQAEKLRQQAEYEKRGPYWQEESYWQEEPQWFQDSWIGL